MTGPSYHSIFAGLQPRGVPVSYTSGQEREQQHSQMRLYLLLLVLLSILTSYNIAQDVEAPHSSSVLSLGTEYSISKSQDSRPIPSIHRSSSSYCEADLVSILLSTDSIPSYISTLFIFAIWILVTVELIPSDGQSITWGTLQTESVPLPSKN